MLEYNIHEIKKKGKLLISHRYNHLPLLPSGPGGIQQELVVQGLPIAKLVKFRTISIYFFKSKLNAPITYTYLNLIIFAGSCPPNF